MMRTLLQIILLAALVSAPTLAVADDRPGPRARLTLRNADITSGDPEPFIGHFFYLENGLTILTRHAFFDANTPMAIALVDTIFAAFKFLAGGNENIPLMTLMNPDEQRQGWITVFEFSGGPQLATLGPVKIGLGAHFEWTWGFSYFDGQRVNLQPADFGAVAHVWYDTGATDLTVAVAAGNGWHEHGKWNPFVHVNPVVDIPLYKKLSLHLSGRVQARRLSFLKYEERGFGDEVPEEDIRVDQAHFGWTLEVGPSLRF